MERKQMPKSCAPVNPPSAQQVNQPCSVVSSRSEGECPNEPYFPNTIKTDVVLAEPTIQVCVEADVELEEPAIEIKRVKKDAVITQCKLVRGRYNRYKLFVAGYIRKNIEYATRSTNTSSAVCGQIRHTTAHVPFHCCTPIEFPFPGAYPQEGYRYGSQSPFLNETGEAPRFDKTQFDEYVCYAEQPFCELVCAEFHEIDFAPPSSTSPVSGIEDEVLYRRLREKIVMELTVKVLQKQQVSVPGIAFVSNDKEQNRPE
ncbi:MAG TPA: hypothetical protein VLA13_07620 [Massilibacterium sp.]|nr:hypothetical protein [Massilibacterium sp.]